MKNSMIYPKNMIDPKNLHTSVHCSFFLVCICLYVHVTVSLHVCDVMFVNAVEGLLSAINYCSCKWENSLTVMLICLKCHVQEITTSEIYLKC